ncbi:acetylxylan esterase [Paramicrobacterium chengjingii]|uniref:Acetylxylan esterase n=1 Tax=Paramicrobacterium chengjingii TaxID=2769067 RepID=A0ABX6YFV6_9MICO|nr:acetylxylan esterase [Microbacterium chengjingii]QPZ37565.1 acetylxylan esterase [Microbacterium chengjingii]
MFVDMPEADLASYRSTQTDPADFDAFWTSTLQQARDAASAPTLTLIDTGLSTINTYDVTFSGFAGQPVKAWLRVPAAATTPLVTVVEYVGYGGGRGHVHENLMWASAGFAHLLMDTRGQGSAWSTGDTPDPDGTGPQFPGMMTRGIDSRETYYYRRVFTDAVRALETARELPMTDAARTVITGGSQGGGITVAVAGLVPDIAAAAPYVPFLCDFRRATVITDNDPYKEIGRYLAVHRNKVESVHKVLSYFDGVNFARRAIAPTLFSASLMDPTCPPSTIYGAFNEWRGDKRMSLWQYNGHEGGGPLDRQYALEFFREVLG